MQGSDFEEVLFDVSNKIYEYLAGLVSLNRTVSESHGDFFKLRWKIFGEESGGSISEGGGVNRCGIWTMAMINNRIVWSKATNIGVYGNAWGVNVKCEYSVEKLSKLNSDYKLGFSNTLGGMFELAHDIFNKIMGSLISMYQTAEGYEILTGLRETGIKINMCYSQKELGDLWNSYYNTGFESVYGLDESSWLNHLGRPVCTQKDEGYFNNVMYIFRNPFVEGTTYLGYDMYQNKGSYSPLFVICHELRHKWDKLHYWPWGSWEWDAEGRAYDSAYKIEKEINNR